MYKIGSLSECVFLSPVRTEQIAYLSPDWFSFDNHVLVGGGVREVQFNDYFKDLDKLY